MMQQAEFRDLLVKRFYPPLDSLLTIRFMSMRNGFSSTRFGSERPVFLSLHVFSSICGAERSDERNLVSLIALQGLFY